MVLVLFINLLEYTLQVASRWDDLPPTALQALRNKGTYASILFLGFFAEFSHFIRIHHPKLLFWLRIFGVCVFSPVDIGNRCLRGCKYFYRLLFFKYSIVCYLNYCLLFTIKFSKLLLKITSLSKSLCK